VAQMLNLPGSAAKGPVGGAHDQPPGRREHEHQTVGGRSSLAPRRYVIRVRLNQGGVRTENFGDATAELEHLSGI
jgi:hypothetical protein